MSIADKIVNGVMDTLEQARSTVPADWNEETDRVKLTANGRSVEVTGSQFEAAARGIGKRNLPQIPMPGIFPDFGEHVEMVVEAVKAMAGNLVDSGLAAKSQTAIQINAQFISGKNVLMDSTVKISMVAQPAKKR